MSTATSPSREEISAQAHETTGHFFWITVVLFVALIILVALQPRLGWGLVIVAVGYVGVGAVMGFLYSTYGDEENKFTPVMTAISTALGGASLADLANRDGLLRQIYHALGSAAALDAGFHGTVLAAGAIFMPLGFFTLYFYRRLVVNRLQRDADAIEAHQREADRTALVPAGELELDATAGDAVFRSDPTARVTAAEWLKRPAATLPTFDDLLGDARAQIALEKYDEATTALEKALRIRPGNPTATLLLAAAYVALDKHDNAVELLETAVRYEPGQVPLNAWKLLGYALLFHDPAKADHRAFLRRAIEASTKYLTVVPDDVGALLNRACAYGQLGPEDPGVRNRLLADLKELLRLSPAARENIRSLTAAGMDFALWSNDQEFKQLLAGEGAV